MPLDPMIARGVPSFMRNVPNTLLAIEDARRQRDNTAIAQQRNDLLSSAQAYEMGEGVRARDAAAEKEGKVRSLAKLEWVMQSKNPKAAMLADTAAVEQFAKNGVDLNSIPDEQFPQFLQGIHARMAGEAGVRPEVPKPAMPEYRTVGNQIVQLPTDASGQVRPVYTAPRALSESSGDAGGYQTLTADQAAALGLPPGTVAQVGPKGKIDVVSTRPQQSLTPKDASSARTKLQQIALAKRQLALVRDRYAALRDSLSSGPGGSYIPTVKGKAADAAVNSMRDTLTSITRVPGIGAMSDFETRLQQAKFPDRGQYEEVSAQQIQSIQDLLDGLEQGYGEMLNDGQSAGQGREDPLGIR